MKVQTIPITSISIAPYNPRIDLRPGDPDFEELKKSFLEFGCVELMVWNQQTGTLVSGHQRLKILLEQGITEVEVSVVDLPIEKEKTLNLALNKIRGRWDEAKLAGMLDELTKLPDFDASLTGFDKVEIGNLFDRYLTSDLDAYGVPPEKDGPPITAKGDLIHLGPHRLLCGDSNSSEDLKRLLRDREVNLLYTDPPYNCHYDSTSRPGQSARDGKWKPIANDWLKQEDYESWLGNFFQNVKPHLAPGAPYYVWNGHRQFGPMHSILTGLGFYVSNVITWVKPSAAPGYGDYWMGSEFCLYGWLEKNGSHRWFGPNSETNVWDVSRDGASSLHPTQKPVSLAQRAIKNSSTRGDLILDCFAGSGSTLIAAQSMERICCAAEISGQYCDSICRRYIKTFGCDSVTPEVLSRYGKAV